MLNVSEEIFVGENTSINIIFVTHFGSILSILSVYLFIALHFKIVYQNIISKVYFDNLVSKLSNNTFISILKTSQYIQN